MKRKTYALLSILVLASLLVACGSNKKKDTAKEPAPAPSVNLIEIQPEPTPEPTPEPAPDYSMFEPAAPEPPVSNEYSPYTFTNLDIYMYATDNVNVRSIPSTEGEKLGKLTIGSTADVTGQCIENSWYRVNYNGTVGYVKNDYLSQNKPVISTPAPTAAPTATPTPAATAATATPAPSASAVPSIAPSPTDGTVAMYPSSVADFNVFYKNGPAGAFYTDANGLKLIYQKADSVEKMYFTAKGILETYPIYLQAHADGSFSAYGCQCCNKSYETDRIMSLDDFKAKSEVSEYKTTTLSDTGAKWVGSDGTIHNLYIINFLRE